MKKNALVVCVCATAIAALLFAGGVTTSAVSDEEKAAHVADLIDAIYVQTRTEQTDAQCAEAKAAWDALTDAQKDLVEGENRSGRAHV